MEFYYDGEYQTWWEQWGRWVLLGIGLFAMLITTIASFGSCVGFTAAMSVAMVKLAIGTAIGTMTSLAIGGAIAGIMSALTGHGFWKGFSESVQESALDALLMSFAITAVTVAVSAIASTLKCFAAGTLVLCKGEDGKECHKKIEDVKESDLVWAYDEESGQSDWKPVTRLFRNTTETWCTVYVKADGEKKFCEITSTPGHKYYLPENEGCREIGERHEHASYEGLSEKWVSAVNLKKGDKVLLSDGEYGIVKKVKVKWLKKPETTYNFEVQDSHTYFVGEHSVCVHNYVCDIEEVVDSLKLSKKYPEDFESMQLMKKSVMDPDVDGALQQIQQGKWEKILNNGFTNGQQKSLHYFKHVKTGKVAGTQLKPNWSPKTKDYTLVYNRFR